MIDRRGRLVACFTALSFAAAAADRTPLFQSHRLTPRGEYTSGIEGPAVDAAGNLYVANFRRRGTIGKVQVGETRSSLFMSLPSKSIGNGIRFDAKGRMFVADYVAHNVFVIEPGGRTPKLYYHSPRFNQPNDLAVTTDGTLFASDPNFAARSGRIWRVIEGGDGLGQGMIMTSSRTMGVTNGLDLSPDERTLYVSESDTGEIWAYPVDGTSLGSPRLVKRFAGKELDGLRTDVDGRLYVIDVSAGNVAVILPDGTLVREIPLRGKQPTNLTFGGLDGKTVFVTQADGGFIESFGVDRPGRRVSATD